MKADIGDLRLEVGPLMKLPGRYPKCGACKVQLLPGDYAAEFRWGKRYPLYLCYSCAEKVTRKLFDTMFVV